MKLYHMPGTRSSRVLWTALELGVDLELQPVNLQTGEGRSAEHLKRHPHGKLPAAEIEGNSLIESGALSLHLACKHGKAPFLPELGSSQGAQLLQWAFYAAATMDDLTIDAFIQQVLVPEAARQQAPIDKGRVMWKETIHPFLSTALGSSPFLMGEHFSFADIMVGYTTYFADQLGWVEGPLKAYVGRLAERPAFESAFAR